LGFSVNAAWAWLQLNDPTISPSATATTHAGHDRSPFLIALYQRKLALAFAPKTKNLFWKEEVDKHYGGLSSHLPERTSAGFGTLPPITS